MSTEKPTLAIIIKALNEEKRIRQSVESCISAINKAKSMIAHAEIILADSASEDKTVQIVKDIAKKEKIAIYIIQLTDTNQRRASVGPQMGYLFTDADLLYVLDGDMVMHPDLLKNLLPALQDDSVAAAAGRIHEPYSGSLTSERYQEKNENQPIGGVPFLEGGGLYKRSFIDRIGYLTDAQLYANEEADIGYQIDALGKKLIRLPVDGITHFRDETDSQGEVLGKFRRKYLHGTGQVLRKYVGTSYFWRQASYAGHYIGLILLWLLGIACLLFSMIHYLFILTYAIILVSGLLLLIVRKQSLSKAWFSVFKWHIAAIGLIVGFFRPHQDPKEYTIHMKKVI